MATGGFCKPLLDTSGKVLCVAILRTGREQSPLVRPRTKMSLLLAAEPLVRTQDVPRGQQKAEDRDALITSQQRRRVQRVKSL